MWSVAAETPAAAPPPPDCGSQRELEGAYGLPHTDLFAASRREVIAELVLEGRLQATIVELIGLPRNGKGPRDLSLSDGTAVKAGKLVFAKGTGTPQWPSWSKAIAGETPADALQHSVAIDLRALRLRPAELILIDGGGLTSAHLSLGPLRRGAKVQLLGGRDGVQGICRAVVKQ